MTESSGGGDGGNKGAGGGGKRGGRRRRRRGGKRGKSGEKAAAGQPGEQKGGQPKGDQQPAAKQGSGKSGRKRRRGGGGGSGGSGSGSNAPQKKQIQLKPFNHVVKKYGVLVFDTFEAAYRDLEKIKDQSSEVDQLNVVIRAEGNMDDPKLMEVEKVKVFAGTAWALIHERRIEDGWYEEPR